MFGPSVSHGHSRRAFLSLDRGRALINCAHLLAFFIDSDDDRKVWFLSDGISCIRLAEPGENSWQSITLNDHLGENPLAHVLRLVQLHRPTDSVAILDNKVVVVVSAIRRAVDHPPTNEIRICMGGPNISMKYRDATHRELIAEQIWGVKAE